MGKVRGVEFGTFWWKNPNRPLINYDQPEIQVYEEASAHACPNAKKVVEKFGAEWTLERYATCDVVMEKLVLETAERLNPRLLTLLTSPIPRIRPIEPVGDHDPDCVPDSHETEMSPGSTSYGYSLPRIIIAAMGRDEKGRLAIMQDRLPAIMEMIENSVESSATQYELLAKIAEESVKLGASSKEVLSHIFAQGIIDEENCVTQYKIIEANLKEYAPELWKKYSKMKPNQKRDNDMWIH